MMKSSKDQEAALLEKTAREFARKTLIPDIHETDRYPHGPFFHDALKIAFESEFLHVSLPETLNGMGWKLKPLCILLQNISRVDASMGSVLLSNAAAQELMLAAGAESILADLVSQDMAATDFLTAFPLFSHPNEKAIQVAAQLRNGNYQLAGTADYMVPGPIAGRYLVPARTSKGFSYFLVDAKNKNAVSGAPIKSLGLHACPAADIAFSNADGILIGREDEGAHIFSKMHEKMMIAAAAAALGIMQASLDDALKYASTRMQGGRKIIEWSELSGMVGQMAVMTKTAGMLLQKAVSDADAKDTEWAVQGFAAATRILSDACTVSTLGVQVLGGYGYMRDYLQEKRFRDSRHLQSVFGAPGRRAIHFLNQFNKSNRK